MGLDSRGDVAIVQLIVYAPILLASQFLLFRHGLKRQHGWLFLAMFAIARIIGAIFLIIEKVETNPSTGVITAAIVLQSIGLSPLILAYNGFLHSIGSGANIFINKLPYSIHAHLVIMAGVALGAVAGADSTEPENANKALVLRKVSAILFLVTFLFLVGVHGLFLMNRREIKSSRWPLLVGITCAVPFLFLRFIYTLGSAFERASANSFNLLTGPISIFVILSVLPEFFTAIIYTVSGFRQPSEGTGDKGSLGSSKSDRKFDMENANSDPNMVQERVTFK